MVTSRLSFLCVLLLVTAGAMAQPAPRPVPVRLGLVQRQSIQQRRLVVGWIEAAQRSLVAAEEPGRVIQAPLEPGTPLDAGAVLARIDTEGLELDRDALKAQVQLAEAQIAERQALLKTIERRVKQLRELTQSGAARQNEMDDALDELAASRSRLTVAQATLLRDQVALNRIELRLRKSVVIAPFASYVVSKATELGRWLNVGDPVAEVVRLDRVKVRLDVPQQMISHIREGDRTSLQVASIGVTRDAEVFRIVPDADPQSRTFRILIRLDNPDRKLLPGMSASAELPTGLMLDALTVPRDAVQTTPAGSVVFVDRDGVADSVFVRVLFGDADRLVVEADLKDGQRVVVEGNERLRSGQPLRVLDTKVPAQE